MASIKEQFEIPGRLKTWAYSLIGIGGAVLLYGMFTKGFSSDEHEQVHFWGTLMYNTIFWTLICNAAMFFLSFSAMAQAAWMQSFRRVPEAISTLVPVFGGITLMVLLYIIFGHKHHIYHWLDSEAVANDPILKGKVGFLNPTFFVIWTTLTIHFGVILVIECVSYLIKRMLHQWMHLLQKHLISKAWYAQDFS